MNDGRVLVGDQDGFAVYDPAADAWSPAAEPLHRCDWRELTTMTTGRVLAQCPSLSGYEHGRLALVYDPAADRWSEAPGAAFGTYDASATALPDGRVLYHGGQYSYGEVEYYQVATVAVDGVPGPVRQVTVGAGKDFVSVSWRPPADEGSSPITGYRVARAIDGTAGPVETVSADTTSLVLTGLPEGSRVEVDVRAVNERGDGRPVLAAPGQVTLGATACTISGTTGDDVLTGTSGPDVLCGRAGDDVFTGLAGDDVIVGGSGTDTARSTAPVKANLGTGRASGEGNDTLREVENLGGTSGNDTLIGDDWNNRLVGAGGNDVINGRHGGDRMRGGQGNDRIRFLEEDRGDGGPGVDTALLAPRDVTDTTIFDMATGELTSDGYYFWQATARGFENTVAGSARDDIYGTDGPNVIRGGKS